ncbi:hypothetical protein AAFF_G00040080 [Aldrovandia affinis]|uniref:Uncharacterized protein n=1 Tax=Aldrovandia affinis TaxID=143900 RepID=A0AAD7S323_9TELE|nr:hypothetical protein AAFF_G00040080 [Aldrovandia affinis]
MADPESPRTQRWQDGSVPGPVRRPTAWLQLGPRVSRRSSQPVRGQALYLSGRRPHLHCILKTYHRQNGDQAPD